MQARDRRQTAVPTRRPKLGPPRRRPGDRRRRRRARITPLPRILRGDDQQQEHARRLLPRRVSLLRLARAARHRRARGDRAAAARGRPSSMTVPATPSRSMRSSGSRSRRRTSYIFVKTDSRSTSGKTFSRRTARPRQVAMSHFSGEPRRTIMSGVGTRAFGAVAIL
jgi:hypothetical protein